MQRNNHLLNTSPTLTWQTAGVAVLLALTIPYQTMAAPTPYEIAIDDLDQVTRKAPLTDKKPAPAPPVRRSAILRHNEHYVRYTIRPGDHIYKILTERFGISSRRAEALIPRIKEINGITNTSGLQIGRNILLPLPVGTHLRKRHRAEAQAAPAQPEGAQTAPPAAATAIVALPDGEAAPVIDTILTSLAITWQQSHTITFTVGPANTSSLALTVDRYFQYGENRYFVIAGGGDPRQATLIRLLEIAGYRRLVLPEQADRRQAAETLLHALGISTAYGKHAITLTPASGAPTTIHLEGYLVSKPAPSGDQVLFTLFPPEPADPSSQPDQQPAPNQSPPAQQPEPARPPTP